MGDHPLAAEPRHPRLTVITSRRSLAGRMGWRTKIMSVPGLLRGLSEEEVSADPVAQFDRWFRFAKSAGVYMPNAMVLATATGDGAPSARMMLLKKHDTDGLVFYTNYESRKAGELEKNPRAAVILHWVELHRQVRVEGSVGRITREESERYFHSRPRGSQLGAWASRQSREIPSRDALREKELEYEQQFEGRAVDLPDYWGGYRLRPERYEFWQGRAHRLHDRIVFVRDHAQWKMTRLSP